jgi:hypothetical protein
MFGGDPADAFAGAGRHGRLTQDAGPGGPARWRNLTMGSSEETENHDL